MKLAGPVILAEVGWMSMGLVDTIMVGPLGPAAIAATGMGSGVFTAIVIFGMGLMLGLDAFVSQAHGAGNERECRLWLHQGVWLACGVAPLAMVLTWLVYSTLDRWGLHPEIRALVGPYLRVIAFSALPLLALRRVSPLPPGHAPGAADHVRPRHGECDQRRRQLGADLRQPRHARARRRGIGVGDERCARVYMAAFLYVAIRLEHRRRGHRHPDGRSRPRSARASGDSSRWDFPPRRRWRSKSASLPRPRRWRAGSIRCRREHIRSRSTSRRSRSWCRSGWRRQRPCGSAMPSAPAIGAGQRTRAGPRWPAGCVMMTAIGLVFFIWPVALLRMFTHRPRIIEIGVGLLAIAAAFQLFDGTQAVVTGALRGISETRMPMIVNFIGHWLLGLPVGYAALLSPGLGRERPLARSIHRPHRRCAGADDGVVEEDSYTRNARCKMQTAKLIQSSRSASQFAVRSLSDNLAFHLASGISHFE